MLTEIKKKIYGVKTFGCDVLAKKAEKITIFDDKLVELANDMVEIMNHFDGIGLAAPQIGISKQLVVLGVPDNPEQTNKSITLLEAIQGKTQGKLLSLKLWRKTGEYRE